MDDSLELKTTTAENKWLNPIAVGVYFAVFKLLLHFVFNSYYGYFRDELYFMACGEHLAWGYPDHAPMVALMAKTSRVLLGDSLFAIRFFSAVAGSLKVFITALLVKEFGGKWLAAFLACLCVLCAPVYLAIDNLLAMNSLEPVFWMLCVYFAVRAVKREDSRCWIWFSVFAGLGLMTKHSTLFFGLALGIGLLVTNTRRVFLNKWIWIGGAIAALIFLPNIIWQIQNNWATIELLQNVQKSGKNVVLSPTAFIGQQIFMMLPTTVFVWLAGIWYFLADKDGRRFRFLGVCYLALLALMIYLKAKDYYLAPIYPMMFAGGAVWWEGVFEGKRRVKGKSKKAKGKSLEFAARPDSIFSRFSPATLFSLFLSFTFYLLPFLIIGMGLLALPFALPILSPNSFLRYENMIGVKPPKAEVAHEGVLPQIYGDQFGWPEMVEKVAEVYNSLSSEEREKTAIFAGNYGEAGAIDLFGAKYNLPKAISGHQSYFLWGPRNYTGEIMILLGASREDAEKRCQSVEEKTELDNPYSMKEEKYKILICRNLKKPLPEIWPSIKHWN